MIRGIHHASITTRDLDRLVRFYGGVLGFETVLETAWEPGNEPADSIYGLKDTAVRMAMLKSGNVFLELFEFQAPLGKPNEARRPVCDAGVTHICLNVENIDQEYERLRSAGTPFHCPPQDVPGIGRATYARDPDGNIFELLEPDPAGPFFQALNG